MDKNKTLEQKRALDAFNKVRGEMNTKDESKYRTCVQSLPATIVMNGLGQAAATLLASGEDAQRTVYNHLQKWLCNNDANTMAPYPGEKNLMSAIVNNDQETYLRAQVEALAWLQWAKKFAAAYLKKPEGGGN